MGKPNRNNPCPCGSEKKYKKCCMEKKTHKIHATNIVDKKNSLFKRLDLNSQFKALGDTKTEKKSEVWEHFKKKAKIKQIHIFAGKDFLEIN